MSEIETTAPQVLTFGCRLNAYESEVIARHLQTTGLACVVVNSCAVTAEAERQVRQRLRQLRRRNPQARIVVTGCAATLAPEDYAKQAAVDAVVVNSEKLQLAPWLALAEKWGATPHQARQDDPRKEQTARTDKPHKSPRKNLEIQQGCTHRCTFCIIPYARGDSLSVSADEVVRRVGALVAAGVQEITFTGVDIASWGAEWQLGLPHLVRQVLREVPALPRLYLSSLDPIALDADFFALWESEPRLQPRLHLSIQAGDDLILKRMRRRHSVALLRRTIPALRQLRPRAAFGADLIAGFPTESLEAFQRGYDLIAELEIPFLHVFPYSPRTGTPATRMPQVPRQEIAKRAEKLRGLGEILASRYRQTLDGQAREILFESAHRGRTAEGVVVESPQPQAIGQLATRLLQSQESGARVLAV